MGETGGGGEGLDGADLVVRGLDGQQQGVVSECRFECVEVNCAVAVYWGDNEVEPLPAQVAAGAEHGGMLDAEGNDAPSRVAALLGRGGYSQDGEVVALSGAAGEDDLLGQGPHGLGDLFARRLDVVRGALSGPVGTGGIGELVHRDALHQRRDGGVAGGGGAMVEIDLRRGCRCIPRGAGGLIAPCERGIVHR